MGYSSCFSLQLLHCLQYVGNTGAVTSAGATDHELQQRPLTASVPQFLAHSQHADNDYTLMYQSQQQQQQQQQHTERVAALSSSQPAAFYSDTGDTVTFHRSSMGTQTTVATAPATAPTVAASAVRSRVGQQSASEVRNTLTLSFDQLLSLAPNIWLL